MFVLVAQATYTYTLLLILLPETLCSKSMTASLILPIIANYWFNDLEYNGMAIMKLGLGVYQVIWYGQKSIVRGVKHVLMLVLFI
jgi:hypothetical protein